MTTGWKQNTTESVVFSYCREALPRLAPAMGGLGIAIINDTY